MFTQRCFIRKNTKELVEKLKELGYNQSFSARGNFGDSLQTTFNNMGGNVYGFLSIPSDKIEEPIIDDINGVNCGTNEELFLAIAALRNNSDRFQWFTNGQEWIQCEKENWIDEISSLCLGGNYNYDKNGELSVDFYKATVEELIKHFNK